MKVPFKRKNALFPLCLFCLLITALTSPTFVSPADGPRNEPALIPASLIRLPDTSSDYTILVDKSAQKVFVYSTNDLFAPVKVYRCSTGENEGQKTARNDRKTPEGIYFFTHSYLKRDLSPRYGARAFSLDYPNPLDRKAGRDGYGIWFHGTNKALKPRDTNGCVAMNNRDIDELASYIQLNRTPVIISDRIEMVDLENMQKEKRALEGVIESWRYHWERKDVDRYMALYSPRFTFGGKGWRQWKRYKSGLASKYNGIKIDIGNLRLLKNDDIVLAKFEQSCKAVGFLESLGEKRLYLQKNSEEWKIIGEFFKPVREKRAEPKPSLAFSQEEIKQLISLWKDAWERKELDTYMSCYDIRFRSRGMDLRGWKKHRERLNRKYEAVKVEISDLEIVPVSNKIAQVRFKQKYRADDYVDFGLKKITLTKRGTDWKIRREQWAPLGRESRL